MLSDNKILFLFSPSSVILAADKLKKGSCLPAPFLSLCFLSSLVKICMVFFQVIDDLLLAVIGLIFTEHTGSNLEYIPHTGRHIFTIPEVIVEYIREMGFHFFHHLHTIRAGAGGHQCINFSIRIFNLIKPNVTGSYTSKEQPS